MSDFLGDLNVVAQYKIYFEKMAVDHMELDKE